MKIIENLNEFIEKVDSAKKVNPLDLSSDQDLSIAIMNLISIEEHLFFSGAKTQDTSFYDLIENIREYRKELLQKIIKSYKGEVWCISKHLLASSMRLTEVATKALHTGNKKEAYDLFDKAYNLYCLFWGLNINQVDEKEVKNFIEIIDKKTLNNIKEDKEKGPNNKEEEIINEYNVNIDKKEEDKKEEDKKSFMGGLKNFINKTVNCCKE